MTERIPHGGYHEMPPGMTWSKESNITVGRSAGRQAEAGRQVRGTKLEALLYSAASTA